MTTPSSFQSLLEQVRQGDQAAMSELMRIYEPHVRRAIRMRMRDRALRQFLDSVDVSQSVMAKFFVKVQDGDFEFQSQNQLIALLVRMGQNRVTDWVRRGQAVRHDYRRQVPLTDANLNQVSSRRNEDGDESPIEASELMAEVRQRLSPLERRLLDRRGQDESWKQIAESEGRSAEALRTQLRRALKRVAVEMGLLEPAS